MSEPAAGVVEKAELVRLRGEVRETAGAVPQLDLPPGEDEPQDHIVSIEKVELVLLSGEVREMTGAVPLLDLPPSVTRTSRKTIL